MCLESVKVYSNITSNSPGLTIALRCPVFLGGCYNGIVIAIVVRKGLQNTTTDLAGSFRGRCMRVCWVCIGP